MTADRVAHWYAEGLSLGRYHRRSAGTYPQPDRCVLPALGLGRVEWLVPRLHLVPGPAVAGWLEDCERVRAAALVGYRAAGAQ